MNAAYLRIDGDHQVKRVGTLGRNTVTIHGTHTEKESKILRNTFILRYISFPQHLVELLRTELLGQEWESYFLGVLAGRFCRAFPTLPYKRWRCLTIGTDEVY